MRCGSGWPRCSAGQRPVPLARERDRLRARRQPAGRAGGDARADRATGCGRAKTSRWWRRRRPPRSAGPSSCRRDAPTQLRPPPAYAADFDRRWSIGSFSALVRALPSAGLWASSMAAVRDDEALQPALPVDGDSGDDGDDREGREEQAGPQEEPQEEPQAEHAGAADIGLVIAPPSASAELLKPWHRFPRGVFARQLPARPAGVAGRRRLRAAGVSGPSAAIAAPLRAAGLGVTRRRRRRVAAQGGVDAAAAAGCVWRRPRFAGRLPAGDGVLVSEREPAVAAHRRPVPRPHAARRRPRPALPERELRGMLMGFADLVFEHGGRYWVLDYKSNHLGTSDADYAEDALERAMAAHRYDVQAALYLVALHRLLEVAAGAGLPARQASGGRDLLLPARHRGPDARLLPGAGGPEAARRHRRAAARDRRGRRMSRRGRKMSPSSGRSKRGSPPTGGGGPDDDEAIPTTGDLFEAASVPVPQPATAPAVPTVPSRRVLAAAPVAAPVTAAAGQYRCAAADAERVERPGLAAPPRQRLCRLHAGPVSRCAAAGGDGRGTASRTWKGGATAAC